MPAGRLEVRLDVEHRKKLGEIVRHRGAPVSVVVRELIDQAYEDARREARRQAVERMVSREIEDVPDPDELNRQLDNRYAALDLR